VINTRSDTVSVSADVGCETASTGVECKDSECTGSGELWRHRCQAGERMCTSLNGSEEIIAITQGLYSNPTGLYTIFFIHYI